MALEDQGSVSLLLLPPNTAYALKLISKQSLIKAVRSLDQSSAESIPDTLSNLWTLLSNSISGPFHASEELILRWLLKNLSGTAETVEQFRRYPLAWRIMACVFRRIPLISLAKSLADRRFVSILQQTLNELSNPRDEATSEPSDVSSDVDMADAGSASPERTSKKRKRSLEVPFDLRKLRTSQGCLRSAEALFDALRTLLARLEQVEAEAPSNILMGAEHVKSLFSSPVKDAVELLRPILSICDLALQEQEPEPLENQASWSATFASLWNLHLQSSSDAAEVAISLYPAGCIILAKIDRSKGLVLDPHVKATWTRDLRRFFIKNMILPARAAFLNRKDIGIIKAAADVTNFMPTASYPVLYSLAVKAPHTTDDANAKKDHEDWTQKMFEILEEPMRGGDPVKRNEAMRIILGTALDSKASISLSGLRTVCRRHTTTFRKMDLNLVTRVANLDVDTFLIENEGHALLDDVLRQVTDVSNAEFEMLSRTAAVDFIVSLAKGFARGRDLSGFIKKWFEALARCLHNGTDCSSIAEVWSSCQVTEIVTTLLQSSMNARQLVALLDWLESQDAASESGPLLVVLDAISHGVTEEELVDAVDLKIYKMISKLKLKSLDNSAKVRWWHIVESAVSRATSEQVEPIWTNVGSELKKALKKGALEDVATAAAFHCCTRLWLANFPGGPHESETAAMASSFFKRAEKHDQDAKSCGLKLFEAPRLVDLLVRSDSGKDHLPKLLVRIGAASITDTYGDVSSLLYNEANFNNYKYINSLVDYAVDELTKEQSGGSAWNTARVVAAMQILLDVPSEALTREQREQIMPKTLSFVSGIQDQEFRLPVSLLQTILSLMVKTMKRPTFYEGMKFADLVTIGDSIIYVIETGGGETIEPGMSSVFGCFKLFEALASNTMRQMTSSMEKREHVYLEEASTTVSNWAISSTGIYPHRHILLKSLVLSLGSCKLNQVVRGVADPDVLRKNSSLMAANCLTAGSPQIICNDADWLRRGLPAWYVLIIIEQLDVCEPAIIQDHLQASKTDYDGFCEMLCGKRLRAGWRLRELLLRCFGEAIKEPLNIKAENVLRPSDGDSSVPLCARADASDIHRYVDYVLRGMDEERRNSYFKSLGQRMRDDENFTGHLLALHRLIRADNGM